MNSKCRHRLSDFWLEALALALLLGGLALAHCARAEGLRADGTWYATLGLGHSRFVGNGFWYDFQPIHANHGYEWTAQDKSNIWSVGLGRSFRWGALEASYHDFGETTSFAGYPYDPGSAALPAGCVYPCTPTQWVEHRGTAQGLSLSALPEWKFCSRCALFGRLGATLYHATFEYSIANERGDPMARRFDAHTSWAYWGVSPVYGAGIRFGGLTVEATRYPSIEAKNSENSTGSWKGIETVTVSYRIDLN